MPLPLDVPMIPVSIWRSALHDDAVFVKYCSIIVAQKHGVIVDMNSFSFSLDLESGSEITEI
jgi:hypothetical protein